jgi:transcription elongation factor Elf1
MKGKDLESVVNCPACGKEAIVVLEDDNDNNFETFLGVIMGNNVKASSFKGEVKCASCGAKIITCISVSAVMEKIA